MALLLLLFTVTCITLQTPCNVNLGGREGESRLTPATDVRLALLHTHTSKALKPLSPTRTIHVFRGDQRVAITSLHITFPDPQVDGDIFIIAPFWITPL